MFSQCGSQKRTKTPLWCKTKNWLQNLYFAGIELQNIWCPTSTQQLACRWRNLITNNDPDIIERMMFCVAGKAWRYQVSEEQTLSILQYHALRLVPPATLTICIRFDVWENPKQFIYLTCSWSCSQAGIAGYRQPENPLELHLVPSVDLLLLLPLQRPQSPDMRRSSICPSVRNKWSQMCSVSIHPQVPACLPILRITISKRPDRPRFRRFHFTKSSQRRRRSWRDWNTESFIWKIREWSDKIEERFMIFVFPLCVTFTEHSLNHFRVAVPPIRFVCWLHIVFLSHLNPSLLLLFGNCSWNFPLSPAFSETKEKINLSLSVCCKIKVGTGPDKHIRCATFMIRERCDEFEF